MFDKLIRFAKANTGFLFVCFLLAVAVVFFVVPDQFTIRDQRTEIKGLTKEVGYLRSLIEPKCPCLNPKP